VFDTESRLDLSACLDTLAGLDLMAAQEFLRANPSLVRSDVALHITEQVAALTLEDAGRAAHFGAIAEWLAEELHDDFCLARARRAVGNLRSRNGRHQAALDLYASASNLFLKLQESSELAITLSNTLQALMYVGRYDQAFDNAERARAIFKSLGDELRLARLDVNLGNVLNRQDRFNDALVLYRRAIPTLTSFGAHRDMAIALMNVAVCSIGLFDFANALDAYRQARQLSNDQHMPLLTAQADYNIAYLHYLRGDFARAIHLYAESRTFCAGIGDSYHAALCDLDQAEMYLDLNLADESEKLAWQAHLAFQQQGLDYENAKSLAFLGMAAILKKNFAAALSLLEAAQQAFVKQQNAVWPALLNIYSGLAYFREGRLPEAGRAIDTALSFFSHSYLSGKAVIAQLLRSMLHLSVGELPAARYWAEAAHGPIEHSATHPLLYLYEYVWGTIEEASGKIEKARAHYLNAGVALETRQLWHSTDELKVPILEDESVIYQAVIATTISAERLKFEHDAAMFGVVQRAKHWNELRDTFRSPTPVHDHNPKSPLAERVVALRQEMNWLNHRITVEELRSERSPDSIAALREKSRVHEAALVATLEELHGVIEEPSDPIVSLDVFVRALPEDCTFLEYLDVRGILHVCVIDHRAMHILPLTSIVGARSMAQSLQEQLSRLARRPGQSFEAKHSPLETLAALYLELLAPIRELLCGRRLIIAPTDTLEQVPFDELWDGSRHVAADFAVCYAKTATSFASSQAKPGSPLPSEES
jgi:tetratricopeptide (TPR) repeat protein